MTEPEVLRYFCLAVCVFTVLFSPRLKPSLKSASFSRLFLGPGVFLGMAVVSPLYSPFPPFFLKLSGIFLDHLKCVLFPSPEH